MPDASVLFGLFVEFLVMIGYLFVSTCLLDDFRKEFHWTKTRIYWTKARITAPVKGFSAYPPCKASISTSAQALICAVRDRGVFLSRRLARIRP
jgi:hypothetical protein